MNGIEKITARIDADTQAEIDRILGDAHAQAEAIAAKYRSQAAAEDADLLVRSQKAAAEREERLVSAAQMEARKSLPVSYTHLDVYKRQVRRGPRHGGSLLPDGGSGGIPLFFQGAAANAIYAAKSI